MNRILCATLLFGLATAGQAAIQINIPVNQYIPDGDAAGMASACNVTGVSGAISGLTVNLNISGTYNGDLYAYLTHGTGFSVLLNRPGRTATDGFGYADHGLNVTFSDGAAADIHNYGGNGGALVTGTYQPDGRNVFPSDVLDTTPRAAMLSSFNGLDANGEWVLFVADCAGGDLNTLVDWGLELDTVAVPEPGMWGGVAGVVLAGWGLLGLRRARG